MKQYDDIPHFPDGFLFGASSSAHQVEGGLTNDWTVWEKANAGRLAAKKHRELGQNNNVTVPPEARDPANYISGEAADHFHRYEEDLDIAASLNLNTFRFSIEWSRIEPQEGTYDHDAIAHYRRVVAACRARGLEPFVTLWHFTLPVWAAGQGGWLSDAVVERFAAYAAHMVQELADVRFWITLNEPETYTLLVYAPSWVLSQDEGWLGPDPGTLGYFLKARRQLAKAHLAAYPRMKQTNPDIQIGVAHIVTYFDGNALAAPVRRIVNTIANDYFIRRFRKTCDWIGLQYYFHCRVNFGWRGLKIYDNQDSKLSDVGWEVYPQAFGPLLRRLAQFGKPIYITETGLADAKDRYRADYIHDSLVEIHKAIESGVDCRGYIHWALTDNFEWDKGFWPRFGLVDIDYKHELKRTVRPSAKSYAQMIKRATRK